MDAFPGHPPPSLPVTSRVEVVTAFLDALAREAYDEALVYVAPGIDWTYRDLTKAAQDAAHGSSALRAFLKRNRTARDATIVCASAHERFIIVSEQVRDGAGRIRERHGAYVVEDDLVTQAWVSDL